MCRHSREIAFEPSALRRSSSIESPLQIIQIHGRPVIGLVLFPTPPIALLPFRSEDGTILVFVKLNTDELGWRRFYERKRKSILATRGRMQIMNHSIVKRMAAYLPKMDCSLLTTILLGHSATF